MQPSPRGKAVLAVVVPSLILFAFMLLVTTNTITNVSGVETEGVGVYWDSGCTNRTTYIDWKTLTPGSTKSVVVYIRNEDDESHFLGISTMNWTPTEASRYIGLRWNYTGQQIDPDDDALKIALILSISPTIKGISSFSFDILVTGTDYWLGDVNGDGSIDILDVKLVSLAWSGLIEEPRADIDGDGRVTILDLVKIFTMAFNS